MFLRGNSSDNPARRQLLESVRQRRGLLIAAFAAMLASAAATGGYAWLIGPLLQSFEAKSGLGDPKGALDSTGLSVAQIVGALLLLGALRALAETVRVHLTAKARLAIVRQFRAELLRHPLDLEPAVLLCWPPGERASRIQVEVHGIRMLLQLGLIQGVRCILVATALASVALGVDTTLAIPGLLYAPICGRRDPLALPPWSQASA